MTLGFLNSRINKLWKWVLYLRANMGEGGGGVASIQAGDNISVDNTDPANPIISSTGGGTELTAGSGIRIEDGEVKLGSNNFTDGLLTEEFTALLAGDVSEGSYTLMGLQRGSHNSIDLNVVTSSVGTGSISVTDTSVQIQATVGTGTQTISIGSVFGNPSWMRVTDHINNKGLQYFEDYSTNGTQDPRWIPDYGAVQALVENSINGGNQIEITEGDATFPQGVLKLQQPIENTGYISISEDTAISFSDTASIHTINFIVGTNSLTIGEDNISTPKTISASAGVNPTDLVNLNQLNTSLADKVDVGVGATVPDTAAQAAGETPTKEEFDALLAELRALKAAI